METLNTTVMSKLPIICDICKEIFPSRNQLFKHVRYDHDQHVNINDKSIQNSVTVEPLLLPNPSPLLRTAYEDDNLLILIKPQGMAAMGVNNTCNEETILKSTYLILENPVDSTYKKAVAVHRLDKCTGGLVLCSKTRVVESVLRSLFRNKTDSLHLDPKQSHFHQGLHPPLEVKEGYGNNANRYCSNSNKRTKLVVVDREVDGSGFGEVYEDIGIKKKYRAIVPGLLPITERKIPCATASADFDVDVAPHTHSNSLQNPLHLGVGYIDSPIGGKHSVTRYEVVKTTPSCIYGLSGPAPEPHPEESESASEPDRNPGSSASPGATGWISTIDCYPMTGRRHQLRKHLASIGHPIIGDRVYSTALHWPNRLQSLSLNQDGTDAEPEAERQLLSYFLNPPFFLWAVELEIPVSVLSEDSGSSSTVMKNPVINSKLKYAGVCDSVLQGISSGITITRGNEFATVRLGEPDYYELFRREQEQKQKQQTVLCSS